MLRVLLPHLPARPWHGGNWPQYRAGLAGLPLELPPGPGAVYHQFAIALDSRDSLRQSLRAAGIGSDVHYPYGVHQEPRFAAGAPRLPETERLVERLLSLPIQPEVARGHVTEIAQAIAGALGRNSPQRG